MNPNNANLPIDDELLSAYLEGRLNAEQEEFVEKAIESSPELQWTVDRWVEMQFDKEEEKVSAIKETDDTQKIIKMRVIRVACVAASILLLMGIFIPLINNGIYTDSGMPLDFPVSERTAKEFSVLPDDSGQNNALQNEEDEEDFSYDIVIYKSALIVMWGQRLEKMTYNVYSSSGRKLLYGISTGCCTTSAGISVINDSDKPLWISMKFYNPGFYYADSIMVNF